jgi:hypothetical protein
VSGKSENKGARRQDKKLLTHRKDAKDLYFSNKAQMYKIKPAYGFLSSA